MTHGHGHGHSGPELEIAPHIRTIAAVAVAPFLIAALIGMAILWPSGDTVETPTAADLYDGEIVAFIPCPTLDGEEPADESQCQMAVVEVQSGPRAGERLEAFYPFGEGAPEFVVGDEIVLGDYNFEDSEVDPPPEIIDFQRWIPLLVLMLLFVSALLVLSRWRGVAALAGLAYSILVLTIFILPALLDGHPPLVVAVVGSAVIMTGAMYLTHGLSVRTTVALAGTLISLTLTGVLGYVFVEWSRFSGLTDESTGFLQFLGVEIDPRGLLLAGLVIGALGVLNDVTVTQTVAVWEIAAANPTAGTKRLLEAGLRLGREHVGATVNTLVLAYAGASLGSFMLLVVSDQGLIHVLTNELVAQEIVRALVGSLGIISAVPLTTALAALAIGAAPRRRGRRAKRVEPSAR